MVQNVMFVYHSPLEKRIVRLIDQSRASRYVLITEPSLNSTTGENIYALMVGCCGEHPPGTAVATYNNLEMTTAWYTVAASFMP